MNLWAYIAKRVLLMLPTLLGVVALTFAVVQFVPGGPVEQALMELKKGAATGGGEASGGGASQYRGRQGIDAERVKEIERLRREARIVMEEGKRQERPRPSLRTKSGEVCVHYRISRPALPSAAMPVVRCQSARVTHLAAPVA